MRTVIPVRSQVLEILQAIHQVAHCPVKIKTKVYEDNMGAFYLATYQRLTLQTKYFLVKYHHFWQDVKDGKIKVLKVETQLQNADY